MKRTGGTLVASSFVREVHQEWTRVGDEQSFVYCTFRNRKRGWVTKESLLSARPDLARAIHAGDWGKMRDGGRTKAKPVTNESVWFEMVHPDEPDQPLHEVAPPDWKERLHDCERRVWQLEVHYAVLLAQFATSTAGDQSPSFDLDAFVTQHSFSEVVAGSPTCAPLAPPSDSTSSWTM